MRARRTTMRFKIRWDRIAASFAMGLLFGVLGCWVVALAFGGN